MSSPASAIMHVRSVTSVAIFSAMPHLRTIGSMLATHSAKHAFTASPSISTPLSASLSYMSNVVMEKACLTNLGALLHVGEGRDALGRRETSIRHVREAHDQEGELQHDSAKRAFNRD